MTIRDGLRSLKCDADMLAMSNASSSCKNLVLYVDRVESQRWDGVHGDVPKTLSMQTMNLLIFL